MTRPTNMFYVNFEGLQVLSMKDIEDIRTQAEAILVPLGRKVNAIVNYDNFFILPDLSDAYVDMVKYPGVSLLRERYPVYDQRLPANENWRRLEGAGSRPAHLRIQGGGPERAETRQLNREISHLNKRMEEVI